MYGKFEVLANVVSIAFILVLTNIFIVLTAIYSRGLLAPLSIYMGFCIISRALKDEKIFDKTLINGQKALTVTVVFLIQFFIIKKYYNIVILVVAYSSSSFIEIMLLILSIYFYIYNCYLLFLLNKDFEIKKVLKLCLIAPLHSLKNSVILIVMLITVLIIMFSSQILLLIFGVTLVLLLNNIILENYYFKLKGDLR